MRKQNRAAADATALEERIGYTFHNKGLAGEALTHASRSHETPDLPCNERLEFLGDAVLELIVSYHLYQTYPDMDEGRMTRIRASVVSEPSLARVAQDIGLPGLLNVGNGMRRNGSLRNPAMLSDAVEAVVGAVYVDSGIDAARAFILPRLMEGIEKAAAEGFSADNKTRLQELVQKDGETAVEYALEDSAGAPHDRTFTVSVLVDGKRVAQGSGRSKKAAQQEAAGKALAELTKQPDESGSTQRAPEKA